MKRLFQGLLAAAALAAAGPAQAAQYWATFWGDQKVSFVFDSNTLGDLYPGSDPSEHFGEGGYSVYIDDYYIEGNGLGYIHFDTGPGTLFNIESDDNQFGQELQGNFSTGYKLFNSANPLGKDIAYKFQPGDDFSVNYQYLQKPGMDAFGSIQNLQYFTLSQSAPTGSAPIGAVPEPATWAMMIIGFGAIGGAMRFRRRKFAYDNPPNAVSISPM